jgi:hypothetical protein
MITRRQVVAWSLVATLAGGAFLTYLLLGVSPFLPEGQPNYAAVLLFFAAVMALAAGLGTLAALALHRRWPSLAGAGRDPRDEAAPSVALRQGLFLAVAAGVTLLLAFLRVLDAAFVLVTVVLLGLLEAFLQNRQS